MTSLWRHLSFLQTIVSNSIEPTNFILGTNTQQHNVHLMIKMKVTLTDDEGHRRRSKVIKKLMVKSRKLFHSQTSSPNWFLWNSDANMQRVYLSDIPNFILIENKRAEIQSRKVNEELWRKKWGLCHCDLDLSPKGTNFNRIRASAVKSRPNRFIRSAGILFTSRSGQTDRQTDTQANCSENITPIRIV